MLKKSWSCSQRGLESKSRDIFMADFDIATGSQSQSSMNIKRNRFKDFSSVFPALHCPRGLTQPPISMQ
jgi:hypothetical protein